MNTDYQHKKNATQSSTVCNILFALLFAQYLNHEIWGLRGVMTGELQQWIIDKGGDSALWLFTLTYGFEAALAITILFVNARWIRWLCFVYGLLLSLYMFIGVIDGIQWFKSIGWYFLFTLLLINTFAATLTLTSYRWAKDL